MEPTAQAVDFPSPCSYSLYQQSHIEGSIVATSLRRGTDNLEGLARAQFGELSEAERRLLQAAPKGGFAFCGPSEMDNDPDNDPTTADNWGPERQIRAQLIRWLCVNQEAANRIDSRGLRLHAGKVTGKLDLSFSAVPFPLVFWKCHVGEDLHFTRANLLVLNLSGSRLRSLNSDGANLTGDLFLRNGVSVENGVFLRGARIGGSLECDGSSFKGPEGKALLADRIRIEGSLFLRGGFSAEGEVRIVGAQIGSNLECDGSTFKNPKGRALTASGAKVSGNIGFGDGFLAEGQVSLQGIRVEGSLSCQRGTFRGSDGRAFSADRSVIGGSLFLRNGFSAEGEVRIFNAQIGSNLECDGSTFKNPKGTALAADGIKVGGAIYLRKQSLAEGEVRLNGAQIGSNLECDESTFRNPEGRALTAHNVKVGGNIFLRNGFAAVGLVSLTGARIGNNLECARGLFKSPSGDFNAENARVEGNVYLRDGFCSEGNVGLRGIQIGGGLKCSNGTFNALDLNTAVIKGTFHAANIQITENTHLDLRNASVCAIIDDKASWPIKGKLSLDGFVYERISEGPTDVDSRMDWLGRLDKFTLQPYHQLAKVFRESGDVHGARRVLFEMEHRRRKEYDRNWLARGWSWILKWSIGYGYRSWHALVGLVLLTLVGGIVFGCGYLGGAIVPNDKEAYLAFEQRGYPPDYYPHFNPFIYSFEHSFPLVSFGLKDHWIPRPAGPDRIPVLRATIPVKLANASFRGWYFFRLNAPGLLHLCLWVQVVMGWGLASLFVAGLTGIVEKQLLKPITGISFLDNRFVQKRATRHL